MTGLAASAASVVAMAGDEILMSPVAYMMIHNPWSICAGNASEMERTATQLREIGEGIITAYQQRTGKTRAEIAALLEAETYMSAQTCVDEGFADGILYQEEGSKDDAKPVSAMMQARRHNGSAVMALLREHAPAQEPAAWRAQAAARAQMIADLFKA